MTTPGLNPDPYQEVLSGEETKAAFEATAQRTSLPEIRDEDLLAKYRGAKGPNIIPDDEMWGLHMNLIDEPLYLSEQ